MWAERAARVLLLGLALSACERPRANAHADAGRDAPPPAPDAALLARLQGLESAANDSLPPGRAHDLALGACTRCHAASLITQQRKTPEEWGKTVEKMVGWGAVLADSDRAVLVAALAARFPAPAPRQPPAVMP